MKITIGFNFFGSCNLQHLDAAWYSLSRQDFSKVRAIYVLDNNTPIDVASIQAVLNRYRFPVPVLFYSFKHLDPSKAHSWSVNKLCRDLMPKDTEWIFWTRSDYILEFSCLQKWRECAESYQQDHPRAKMFITSFCHLIGYNFAEKDGKKVTDHGPVDIEALNWREKGPRYLIGRVPGYSFEGTYQDAGVWLTQRKNLEAIGWMNENLKSWGFQQSVAQLNMKFKHKVKMCVASEYFFHHMEHWVDRDILKARAEFERYIEPILKQEQMQPQS